MTACPWFIICDWYAIIALSVVALMIIWLIIDWYSAVRVIYMSLTIAALFLVLWYWVLPDTIDTQYKMQEQKNACVMDCARENAKTPGAPTCFCTDAHVASRAAMAGIFSVGGFFLAFLVAVAVWYFFFIRVEGGADLHD